MHGREIDRPEVDLICMHGGFRSNRPIFTIVYLFQPWRSCCPYDDSPAACAMLPADATAMTIAMFGTLIGLVVLVLGLLVRRASAIR
jgi:hypothetical protein